MRSKITRITLTACALCFLLSHGLHASVRYAGALWEPQADGKAASAFEFLNPGEGRITRVHVWSGEFVDAIEVFIDGVSQGKKGGPGGGKNEVNLDHGEWITSVYGFCGHALDNIGFKTNRGRNFGPFSKICPSSFNFDTGSGEVLSFFGRSGRYGAHPHIINSIGITYLKAGERRKAELYSELSSIHSELRSTHAGLATIREELRRVEEARATLAALTPEQAARTAALRSVADRLFG
jgi:hypothetical protein